MTWRLYTDIATMIGALDSSVDPLLSGRSRPKLVFYITEQNTTHTHVTVYQDGGMCGRLCMNTETWVKFAVLLHCSTKRSPDLEFELSSHFDERVIDDDKLDE